jgi:hypothetical protein
MSVSSRNRRASQDRRTIAQKREAVLSFLNDPNLSPLSDREISRRTRVSQPFVSMLRKFVISQGGHISGSGPITAPHGPDNGHPEAVFESPTLSSYSWATAEPGVQRRFVDGVGLRALYDAAPPDHRDAFIASLLAQLPRIERPRHLPPNIEMYLNRIEGGACGDGLDIPLHLRRSGSEGSR